MFDKFINFYDNNYTHNHLLLNDNIIILYIIIKLLFINVYV